MEPIETLHAQWLALGAKACVKETPTAYKDLKEWESAHFDRWDELVIFDLQQKGVVLEP